MENGLLSWSRRFNIVKIAILPQKIDRFKVISNQNSSIFFFRNGKADLQIHMELKMGLSQSWKQRTELEGSYFFISTHIIATINKQCGIGRGQLNKSVK